MNTLAPLPLVDGCLLLDNSSIEKFQCPRKWQHSELDLRSAVAEKAGANFGSTMHRGWEQRYKLVGTGPVAGQNIDTIESAMRDHLAENPQPQGDFRDFNHACKMMRSYLQIYPQENFKIVATREGKPIIEASFMLPFAVIWRETGVVSTWNGDASVHAIISSDGIPVYYCGKLDLGIEDSNGLWSFDHKTAFQFGDSWLKQMSMDGGQLGYCWALGQTLNRPVAGYIIDGVRVRKPSTSQKFLGEAPIDGTDFCRIPNFVTPEMLDEWKEDVRNIISQIFAMHSREYFPRHRWQCVGKYGVCEFFDVCSTARAQRDIVLQSGLYEENKWSKGLKVVQG